MQQIVIFHFFTSLLGEPLNEKKDELPSITFRIVNEGNSTANEIHAFIAFPETFELFRASDLTPSIPYIDIPSSDSSDPSIDEDHPWEVNFYQKKLVQGLAVQFGEVYVKPPKEKHPATYPIFYGIYAEEGQFKGELSLHVGPIFKEVKIYE